jgi:hypothetical protein
MTHLLTLGLLTVILSAPSVAGAQTEAPTPVKATLADFHWLVGEWTGSGMGGESQELWAPPAGGAMMGMFRQLQAGRLVFYEFLTLVEREGSVALRLKHFHPDLTGWEEKGQVLDFPLVAMTPTQAVFGAITFTRESPDAFSVTVRMRDKDGGQVREERFTYKRVKP